TDIAEFLAQGLPTRDFVGIGEFHLYDGTAPDIEPVQAVVRAANEHQLFLIAHVRPLHIEAFFSEIPNIRILWDHAGYLNPYELEPYLAQHPQLFVDLAGRDAEIAPGGILNGAWASLIHRYPDRFMVGSDPYTDQLAAELSTIYDGIRAW